MITAAAPVQPLPLDGPRWWRRGARQLAGALAYGLALAPLSLAAGAAVILGRPQLAVAWWLGAQARVLGVQHAPAVRPGWPAVAWHGLLSLLLAGVALIPLGCQLLFVFRGVLYGVVTAGPHTRDWGGPTLAGAWLAHFAIGLAVAVAGLFALRGIAELHRRLTAGLVGHPVARWVQPLAVAISVLGGLLIVLWLRQL